MVRSKLPDKLEGVVLGLLQTSCTYRKIQEHVKAMGYTISLGSIKNIRDGVGIKRQISQFGGHLAKYKNAPQWLHVTLFRRSPG